jgi:serine/threonine protein kinase
VESVGSSSAGGSLAAKAGTVRYMAPEQWREETSTRQADVYALGGILYAALTGRSPYPQRSLTELAMAVAMSPPPAPSAHGAPAQFDFVVAKAMAKHADDRFDGVVAFAEALRAAARGEAPKPRSKFERYRWWLTGVAVIVGGVLGSLLHHPGSSTPTDSPQVISRTVCAETVGLRDAPGADGHEIGVLRHGETVTLDHHHDSGPWSLVLTPDGREAWALNEHLRSSCPG